MLEFYFGSHSDLFPENDVVASNKEKIEEKKDAVGNVDGEENYASEMDEFVPVLFDDEGATGSSEASDGIGLLGSIWNLGAAAISLPGRAVGATVQGALDVGKIAVNKAKETANKAKDAAVGFVKDAALSNYMSLFPDFVKGANNDIKESEERMADLDQHYIRFYKWVSRLAVKNGVSAFYDNVGLDYAPKDCIENVIKMNVAEGFANLAQHLKEMPKECNVFINLVILLDRTIKEQLPENMDALSEKELNVVFCKVVEEIFKLFFPKGAASIKAPIAEKEWRITEYLFRLGISYCVPYLLDFNLPLRKGFEDRVSLEAKARKGLGTDRDLIHILKKPTPFIKAQIMNYVNSNVNLTEIIKSVLDIEFAASPIATSPIEARRNSYTPSIPKAPKLREQRRYSVDHHGDAGAHKSKALRNDKQMKNFSHHELAAYLSDSIQKLLSTNEPELQKSGLFIEDCIINLVLACLAKGVDFAIFEEPNHVKPSEAAAAVQAEEDNSVQENSIFWKLTMQLFKKLKAFGFPDSEVENSQFNEALARFIAELPLPNIPGFSYVKKLDIEKLDNKRLDNEKLGVKKSEFIEKSEFIKKIEILLKPEIMAAAASWERLNLRQSNPYNDMRAYPLDKEVKALINQLVDLIIKKNLDLYFTNDPINLIHQIDSINDLIHQFFPNLKLEPETIELFKKSISNVSQKAAPHSEQNFINSLKFSIYTIALLLYQKIKKANPVADDSSLLLQFLGNLFKEFQYVFGMTDQEQDELKATFKKMNIKSRLETEKGFYLGKCSEFENTIKNHPEKESLQKIIDLNSQLVLTDQRLHKLEKQLEKNFSILENLPLLNVENGRRDWKWDKERLQLLRDALDFHFNNELKVYGIRSITNHNIKLRND